MAVGKRIVTLAPALPVAGTAFVLSQVLRAARRRDLPSFANQDPSGTFGGPSRPALRMVALGDSSLTAPGVEDLSNVWIRRIVTALNDRYRIELVVVAVGGAKAKDVIEGQLAAAERMAPDIAVVSVGANDAIRGVRPGVYHRRLEHILDRLGRVSQSIVLIGMGDLGSIPRLPPALRPYLTRRSIAFDDVATAAAVAHPKTIKVYTRGRFSTAFYESDEYFAGDMFHASDLGHGIFAEEALPAFEAAVAMTERAKERQ